MYGTTSFTSYPYMTLINTGLLSILPNFFNFFFFAEWEAESFCSLHIRGCVEKRFLTLSHHMSKTPNIQQHRLRPLPLEQVAISSHRPRV